MRKLVSKKRGPAFLSTLKLKVIWPFNCFSDKGYKVQQGSNTDAIKRRYTSLKHVI